MMKKILTITAASLILWGCNSDRRQTETSDSVFISMDSVDLPKDTAETDKTETTSKKVTDGHNAANALDWTGTYKGVLPCADCEGIETEITIDDNMQYVIKTKYLGKGDGKTFEEKGVFSWDKDGTILTFETPGEASKKYFVGENTLTQLNPDGTKVTGALAKNYILKK